MIIPNPAVVTITEPEFDPVTETTDYGTSTLYVAGLSIDPVDNGGFSVNYVDPFDGTVRGFPVPSVTELGDGTIVGPDNSVIIRAVDSRDAIALMPTVGVAQPIPAIRAEIIRGGGVLATELDAVVAEDNSVVTLMLETGVGTYVRYASDWQLLGPDSTSLEDLSLVAVGPGAIDVYDTAENARTTVSVFELPVPSKRDADLSIEDPSELPVDTENLDGEPVTAAGALIPTIASIQDMDMGLRFAAVHPGARWYVSKRAKALGVSERIPSSWNVVLVR